MILSLKLQALQLAWTCGLQSFFISRKLWLGHNGGEGKNVISINQYTIIKAVIYIVVFLNIFLMQHKKNIFDIYERTTLTKFIKSICCVVLLGLLNVAVYIFRYLYLENNLFSPILMIFQIVISYGFEILLITSWLRCFYMSEKIHLGYVCIALWILSRFIGAPVFFLFLFITVICALLLRKHNKNRSFKNLKDIDG